MQCEHSSAPEWTRSLSAALWWRSDRGTLSPEPHAVKTRLLVVPHPYADDISVREIELARRLTSTFDVFLLKWRDALHVEEKSAFARRVKQVGVGLRAGLRSRTQVKGPDGLQVIEVPVWQPLLLQRLVGSETALSVCQSRNHGTLRDLIRDVEITHLLLASELFGIERIPGVRTFYDVVDWFSEDSFSSDGLARIRAGLRAISEKVDGVFAVSQPLCEKLERDCGVQALPLPNGANVGALRSVAPAKISALRQRLGVAENFVM